MEFHETDHRRNPSNSSHISSSNDYAEYNQAYQYLNPNMYGTSVNNLLYSSGPEYGYMEERDNKNADFNEEEYEPPLLEELEIDLYLVKKRIIAILDPFHSGVIMGSYDLAGPCFICLLFAFCSLISGAKINFNHVYSLSAFSCLFMYLLLTLMTSSDEITLSSVTSILGYSLLPLVLLSCVGLFINLYSFVGIIMSMVAVLWCTFAATKMFTGMGNSVDKKMLIAYPCVLCYGLPSDINQVHQPILVCTAHIHWDPEYCDVKLIQIMMLSHELRNILEEASQNFRPGHKPDISSVQLLLCGDFNSLPDSGVIEFLSTGRVNADHQDFKDLPYKSVLQKISGCEKPNEFTHSFKLSSAYGEDIMPYTNYTFHFKGIIDYIFYSKQNMTPLGLLGPLSQDWFKTNKIIGCPHPHIPSDHFPLLVELEMSPSVPSPMNGLLNRR